MVKIRLTLITILLILSSSLLPAEELLLASWNIRILSDGSRDDSELAQIASIIDRYDLVAVQEVRDTRVLDRLTGMLPGWEYTASELVGRGVKELYAFLYRTDRVIPLSPARVIDDPGDVFIREPAVASFQAGAFDFTLVSNHILFGDSKSDRREEIVLLDDLMALIDALNGDEGDLILLGDFNMPASDNGWEMAGYTPLVSPGLKTTITDTSSYDNMWLPDGQTYHSEFIAFEGAYRFDEILFRDDDAAKLAVSDHRPISARFSTDYDDDGGSGVLPAISFDPGGAGTKAESIAPDHVYIAEVVTSPTESESVTLYNPTDRPVQLRGWVLGDKNDPNAYRFASRVLRPSTYLEVTHDALPFQINNRDEIIYLFDDTGDMISIWED